MRASRWFAAALLPLAALAQPVLDAGQDARYRALIDELRCLVCQNETVADSTAPLAADLREQVHKQIVEGRSDAEIKKYLTDRYGDFVLYRPPLKTRTWLLWGGPFALLLFAAAIAARFARRSRPPVTAPADSAALRALLEDEK